VSEFRLYFKDADEAHSAQARVEKSRRPITRIEDVPTDVRGIAELFATDPIEMWRSIQRSILAMPPVTVAWPVSIEHDSIPGSEYAAELILEAQSYEHVKAVVRDLDYTWEAS
jgi:hypothetical protein